MTEPLRVQGSLLPLTNGAKVLAADVWVQANGMGAGIVLAITADGEYVTWRVYRQRGDETWLADSGDYDIPQDLRGAGEAYETRRSEP